MLYIGIDPDIKENGVAIWNKKSLELYNMNFFELQKTLELNKEKISKVIISAGWLNKSNFHAKSKFNKNQNSIIGERVGANHQVGKMIGAYCEYLKINYSFSKPKQKKLNKHEFAVLTGYKKNTNQEKRDAGILVYGY